MGRKHYTKIKHIDYCEVCSGGKLVEEIEFIECIMDHLVYLEIIKRKLRALDEKTVFMVKLCFFHMTMTQNIHHVVLTKNDCSITLLSSCILLDLNSISRSFLGDAGSRTQYDTKRNFWRNGQRLLLKK